MNKLAILLCLGLLGCATQSGVKNPEVIQTTASSKYITIDQKELDNIIAIFSEAIKNNPNYSGAYYNRSIAYFYKKEYDLSWQDFHKAESLGSKFNADFVESLEKASGRTQ